MRHRTRLLLLAALGLSSLKVPAFAADDTKPAGAVVKDEAVGKLLLEAVKAIKAIDEEQAKASDVPDFTRMRQRMGEDDEIEVLGLIATAQAKAGDSEGARETFREASDVAGKIGEPAGRAAALQKLATTQAEAGEKEGALDSAKQALVATRSIRPGRPSPFPAPPGFESDESVKKVNTLSLVAAAQRKAGDATAARATMAKAVTATESVKDSLARAGALAEVARLDDPKTADAAWDRALKFAVGLEDELQRGLAVGGLLRSRARDRQFGPAAEMTRSLPKGDLQSYALLVLADLMATADPPPARAEADRLVALALASPYDRYPKKSKVFERVATVQARCGDMEGAEKTVGLLDAGNSIRRSRALSARVSVLVVGAKALAKAGEKKDARESLGVVLDLISPFQGDDGLASYFPISDVVDALADADDLPGAIALAKAMSDGMVKVEVLAKLARRQSLANDRPAAKRTLGLALLAAKGISNDSLWTLSTELKQPMELQFIGGMRFRGDRALALATSAAGDVEGAIRMARAIVADKGYAGQSEGNEALRELANDLILAGDFATARSLVKADSEVVMMFEDENATLIQSIAKGQAKAGGEAAVLAWVKDQKTPKSKLAVLRGLAGGVIDRMSATPVATTTNPTKDASPCGPP